MPSPNSTPRPERHRHPLGSAPAFVSPWDASSVILPAMAEHSVKSSLTGSEASAARAASPPAQGRSRHPEAELRAVSELGKVLTSTLELPEVLGRIMEVVHDLLQARQWSMLLVDEETGRLRFEIAVGEGAEAIRGCTLSMGEGVAGWVAERGEPLLVPKVKSDPRWCARFDQASGFCTQSILAVPLKLRGEVIGLIELIGGEGDAPFDADDQRVLSLLADFAAIAIQNARIFARIQASSLQDEHTGLFNARYLQQALAREVERGRRYRRPLSLVFFDLDRFKAVNDLHGHLAGSALLAEVGDVLRGVCRKTDVACRYGGDEFVVLLPQTDRVGAMDCAERMRSAVAARHFLADRGDPIRITASFGVASFPEDGEDAESLLGRADGAMYEVKARGRDGVRAATGEDEEPSPREE
ncbi:MAG: diguanylate cyclase [Myxococcota bacterium]